MPFMSKDHTLLRLVGALMVIVGFGASVTGLLALMAVGTSGDGPPECDGVIMQPGDSCWTQYGGQQNVSTYEEIMRRKESGEGERQVKVAGGVGLGGGVVLLLGSEWIRRRVRRYN